ncbi:MAG: recombination mediator RecR [Patescibacteria group bacterium]
MAKFPPTMQKLIDEFSRLPTIGPKTAERFVFYLLRYPQHITALAAALTDLKGKVTTCQECFTFSEKSPCYICSNPKRDRSMMCVVASTTDLAAMENTGHYQGLYHVLGGTIDALDHHTPLTTNQLETRIKFGSISEVILAFNLDVDGEGTILFLQKLLQPLNVKITRLARGLPMGSDLVYADEVTLSNALENRKEI